MNLDYEILKTELLQALDDHKIWVLASSDGKRVSARSMSIIHNDLDIYFQTSRKFDKYAQLVHNPHVALCWSNISIEGLAYDLGPWEENLDMRGIYIQHHRGSYEAYGTLPEQVVVKVVPNYVVFWKYIEGQPVRDFLYISEKRATREFYLKQP